MDNLSQVSKNLMEASTEDRRKRRTRQLLRQALLGLLEEKPYPAISVQDIIAHADVARSTFYMHYQDKDDLFLGPEGVFADKLTRQHRLEVDPTDIGSLLSAWVWLEHIDAQRPTLKALAGNPALDLAMQTLREMLGEDYRKRVNWLPNAALPPEVVADYLVGSLMVLIRWWLGTDTPRTPQQMDELFQQLVHPGLRVLGLRV